MGLKGFKNTEDIQDGRLEYRRKDGLIMRKLREYIPAMMMTNISMFFIHCIDQVVAGNFIGQEAMEAISIFHPISLLTGVFSAAVASGISTSLSNSIGKNDVSDIAHTKTIGLRLMMIIVALASIIQIPMVFYVIGSFGLSQELSGMIWEYGIGVMIATPFGIISTVGNYQLQIAGKVKALMILTAIEGGTNIVLDVLFVRVFDMGVGGTGLGTAFANVLRCTFTVLYIMKKTDFYKGDGKPVKLKEYWKTLEPGLPDAAFIMMLSFQNYFALRIVLSAFGEGGGVIYGVCSFCLNLANIRLYGIQGGTRPLMGLYAGANDRKGLSQLMRRGLWNVITFGCALILLVGIFPELFYIIQGIKNIPDGGELSIKIYSLMVLFRGANLLFRMYFANRKDVRFATALTIMGNAMLPVFAFLISRSGAPAPYIFMAYSLTELVMLVLSLIRYYRFKAIDDREDKEDIVLYMTVKREDAVKASRYIRTFADEHGIDKRIAYRMALCIEEIVAYVEEADKFTLIPEKDISVDLIIRFIDSHHGLFISLDEGAFIQLDAQDEDKALITENYGLIRKIAKNVEYQYILNMNYTKIEFE